MRRWTLPLVAAAVLAATMADASADHDRRHRWDDAIAERGQRAPREQAGERAPAVSRDRAARIAASATGGRVLGVRLERSGRYRVKLLLDGGRVRVIRVDARTGAVLD